MDESIRLLVQLARERHVAERRDTMFRGEKINNTEERAVLHVALRALRGLHIPIDGHDVVPDLHAVMDEMADFAKKVRSSKWNGQTGARIKNVINIGIGGSCLGPERAYQGAAGGAVRAQRLRARRGDSFDQWGVELGTGKRRPTFS